MAELVELQKRMHNLVKGIDPNALVLTPPRGGGPMDAAHDPYYENYFSAGGGAYADIITF
jgi:hypothetical protein